MILVSTVGMGISYTRVVKLDRTLTSPRNRQQLLTYRRVTGIAFFGLVFVLLAMIFGLWTQGIYGFWSQV